MQRARLGVERDRAVEPARVADGAVDQHAEVVVARAARGSSSSERDSSGEMTENDGFSVVAATRMTQPFSTPGSSASCCALVKRWISSRNKHGRDAVEVAGGHRLLHDLAHVLDAGGDRRELDELRCEPRAMACARVVLPVPGGPQRMMDAEPWLPSASEAKRTSGDPRCSRCC